MTCTTCIEFEVTKSISGSSSLRALAVSDHGETLRCRSTTYKRVPIEKSTPANIMFDTQTDIIESVQETVFINDDQDIIHIDSDIEIGHNVDTSVQCGSSTLSPITHTEIAINLLCDKCIDADNDYEDEFYDFQDELEILRMSRDN